MTDPLFEITFDAATGEMQQRELTAEEIAQLPTQETMPE
jgi:hypothetical protein